MYGSYANIIIKRMGLYGNLTTISQTLTHRLYKSVIISISSSATIWAFTWSMFEVAVICHCFRRHKLLAKMQLLNSHLSHVFHQDDLAAILKTGFGLKRVRSGNNIGESSRGQYLV